MKNIQLLFTYLSLMVLSSLQTWATPQTSATLNVGVNPQHLAITPDGKYAYVANSNTYQIANSDTVTVLDLESQTLVKTIRHESFNQPYTITLNKEGTRAYVTNSNSTSIAIIDTSTNEVTGLIDGFDGPSGVAITPDGAYAYVNNYGGPEGKKSGNANGLRKVDMKTHKIIGEPIMVDLAPAAIAMSPNGKFVYSANYVDGNPGTGTLNVISTESDEIVATVRGLSGPFAIDITPDGKFAYITNFGSNNFTPIGTTVSVVDLSTYTIAANIELGIQPSGVAISPDGKHAYVTNYNSLYTEPNYTALTPGQGTVNIIDTATHKVIAPTLVAGQSPSNIVVAPDGKKAYVSNYASNTLTVLEL